jgi:hypothetical protein
MNLHFSITLRIEDPYSIDMGTYQSFLQLFNAELLNMRYDTLSLQYTTSDHICPSGNFYFYFLFFFLFFFFKKKKKKKTLKLVRVAKYHILLKILAI